MKIWLFVWTFFFHFFKWKKSKAESKLCDFLYEIDVISWKSFGAFSLLLELQKKKHAPPKSIKYLKIVYLTCFSDPFHLLLICLLIHHLQMWSLHCLHALVCVNWVECVVANWLEPMEKTQPTTTTLMTTDNLFPDGNRIENSVNLFYSPLCAFAFELNWYKSVFFLRLLGIPGKVKPQNIETLASREMQRESIVIKRNLIMKMSIFIQIDIDERVNGRERARVRKAASKHSRVPPDKRKHNH